MLERIKEVLRQLYGDDEFDVEACCTLPQPILGGKTVVQMIEAGRGDEALAVFQAVADGAYL